MSTEIATIERVQAAVDKLHSKGLKATADAVIEEIGGGSKPTVLKHMRSLRQIAESPAESMPSALFEKAKPMLAEVFAAGVAAEEARTHEQTDRYHRMMSDLEAQLAEFETSGAAQEKQITELTERLAVSDRALAESNDRLARRDAELVRLQAELSDCRREMADALSDRLAAFETRFEELSAKMDGPKAQAQDRARKDKE